MLRRTMMAGVYGPPVTSDDFSVDTSSQYTLAGSGTPSFAIGGGYCTITTPSGAANATVTRNGTSIYNGYVETETDMANDSGIVFRFVDNNNHYLLGLSDDSGASATINVMLYRKVSGSYTNITTPLNITWTRGSNKKFKLEGVGTTLNVYVDDVLVRTVVDSGIGVAGKIGMRGNYVSAGSTNRFDVLRWG